MRSHVAFFFNQRLFLFPFSFFLFDKWTENLTLFYNMFYINSTKLTLQNHFKVKSSIECAFKTSDHNNLLLRVLCKFTFSSINFIKSSFPLLFFCRHIYKIHKIHIFLTSNLPILHFILIIPT